MHTTDGDLSATVEDTYQGRYPAIHDAIAVEELIQPIAPAPCAQNCLEVVDRFVGNKELYAIAIVDEDGVPIGIVDRANLIELFVKPYARDLNHRKPIAAFMDANPIVVDRGTDIDDLSQIVIDEGLRYTVNVFVVTRQGKYLGTGTALDLLKAMTRRKQQQLFSLAHYDALTRLPNRLLFHDRLEQACRLGARNSHAFALMFMDLDHFKEVNDTLGHAAGDCLLQAASHRLQGCIRASDTLARLGGDEFVVILQLVKSKSAPDRIAKTMLETLRPPFLIDGHEVHVTLSIGIALFPQDASDPESLIAKADAAMYAAKQAGRDRYVACSRFSQPHQEARG